MKKQYILYLLLVSPFIKCGKKKELPFFDNNGFHSSERDNTEVGIRSSVDRECKEWCVIDSNPNPPLMDAIMENNLSEVARLLEEGADPNRCNSCGSTPLSFATHCFDDVRNPEITKLLLKYGADPNAFSMTKSNDNYRELDSAILFGTQEHVGLLLKYGANPFELKENHEKVTGGELERVKQNILLVQKERIKQRITTLFLCLEKAKFPKELCLIFKSIC